MDVLVDTAVWPLALRRRSPDLAMRRTMDDLIATHRVGIIGPVRQECLSGVNDPGNYARLRTFFRSFPDIPLISEDYELAASFFNSCRAEGIHGSHTDFLICAVANRARLLVFTTDKDFDRYGNVIPISRFKP